MHFHVAIRISRSVPVFFCRLLADELTYLATDADAQRFVDGELPEGIGAATDVAVLGLFTAETNTGAWVVLPWPIIFVEAISWSCT